MSMPNIMLLTTLIVLVITTKSSAAIDVNYSRSTVYPISLNITIIVSVGNTTIYRHETDESSGEFSVECQCGQVIDLNGYWIYADIDGLKLKCSFFSDSTSIDCPTLPPTLLPTPLQST